MEKLTEEQTIETNNLIKKAVQKYFTWYPPDVPTFENAVQECWLALLESDYDSSKGAWSTFIFQVVQRKYQKLLRDANRDKRAGNINALEFIDDVGIVEAFPGQLGGSYERRQKLLTSEKRDEKKY